jgi:hemoglobin-like flavoprotein
VDISQSLDRILNSQDVLGELFYDIFLHQYPEVQHFFEGVNLRRQAVLLTMALIIVEQYYSNPYPTTAEYLRYLGSKHHQLNIPKELYGKWADAMLTTLRQFHGKDWTEDLARQWREAIDRTTQQMFAGY